jgi:crotonobetainyl-CoA:carnitine CoA-transferase CaiB-like acyl-CoA transferase
VEVGAIIAGPYAGSLLAELGADVLKVEPPLGDPFRSFGPGFIPYNKGKRSAVLDLRADEGAAAFRALAAEADVVIDNFRPGVLSRLGITYDSLAALNQPIITVSVTGFGEGGPLELAPGFDPILQAMSGMMIAQGGDDDPVFFTVPVNDVASAVTSAFGACLALWHRERSGQGQRVWTSLAGNAALMQSGELVRYAGRAPAPRGGRDFSGPGPADRFVATADGWVRVQGTTTQPTAAAESDLIERLLAMPTADAIRALTAAGVPAVSARRIDDLPADADLIAWEMLHQHGRGDESPLWTAGRLARFSRTERAGPTLAPQLGEHTDAVLAEPGWSLLRN